MFPSRVGLCLTTTLLCRKGSDYMAKQLRTHLAVRDGERVYETATVVAVLGAHNARFINLDFAHGRVYDQGQIMFVPINPNKPIVLALECDMTPGFFHLDYHLRDEWGMKNTSVFKSENFIIECGRLEQCRPMVPFWSVLVSGQRFLQTRDGQVPENLHTFWQVDLDRLCAFVGGAYGDRGGHELRAHAARFKRTKGKSDLMRLEDRVRALACGERDALRTAALGLSSVLEFRELLAAAYSRLDTVTDEKRNLSKLIGATIGRLRTFARSRRPYFGWRRDLLLTAEDLERESKIS